MARKKKKTSYLKARVIIVFCFFIVCFSFLLFKIFVLQILPNSNLESLKERQHKTNIEFLSNRGSIFDRNLHELATSNIVNSIAINPKKVKNRDAVSRKLAKALGIKKSALSKRIKNGKYFSWVKRKVQDNEVLKVKKLNIPSVFFVKERKRFYPNKLLASNVLGFVGSDPQGLAGLELYYNNILEQGDLTLSGIRDAFGRSIPMEGTISDSPGVKHIVLTIDKDIQYIVERELLTALKKYNAKSAMAIVTIPQSGEILALVSVPNYDPNEFWKFDRSLYNNPAVTSEFEPGSTVKMFVVAGALEEKLVSVSDKMFCENGTYLLHRTNIHDTKPHGYLSIKDIIRVSSNIGAVKVAKIMGEDKLMHWFAEFGFGSKTGIDLPYEAKGVLKDLIGLNDFDFGAAAFGQGMSCSAIQLIAAANAIANGGYLIKPKLVKYILDSKSEIIKEFESVIVKKVIKEETSNILLKILRSVVEEDGTGKYAKINGIEVAGKTATAQKFDFSVKRYSNDKYYVSFIGFLPALNPRLSVLVIIDEPQELKSGGLVAAPVFKSLVERMISYLDIRSTSTELNIVKMNSNSDEQKEKAVMQKTVRKSSKKYAKLALGDEMPDIRGESVRSVLRMFDGKKINLVISGQGYAVKQSLPPGAKLKKNIKLMVNFRDVN